MRRLSIIVVILASTFILLWDLDALDVTIMEARNFVTAREMVEDGSYLIPTLNDEYRLAKPPLPTWLTALVGSITDMKSVFWLRVPAVLFGLLALFFSMKIVRSQSDAKCDPALTGAILVTSFYFFLIARSGMWDMFAQGFMLGGIYYYIQFWQRDTSSSYYTLLFALFCTGSLMSKGPVALYGLFLPFLLAYHFVYRNEVKISSRKILMIVGGLALGLILTTLWPLYIHFSEAGQAAAEIIKKEAGNWSSYNVKPLYYYWSFPIQSGIWTIFGFIGLLVYAIFYSKMKSNKALRFYFWWTMLVVVLLSVIPEKKSRYLLPVLFPMAMFLSEAVQAIEFSKLQKSLKIAAFITGVVLGLIGITMLLNLRPETVKLDNRVAGGLVLLLCGVVAIYSIYRRSLPFATYVLAIAVGFFVFLFIQSTGELMASKNAVNSFRRFDSEPELQSIRVYSIDEMRPELLWHLGRKAPRVSIHTQLGKEDVIGVFSPEKFQFYKTEVELLENWEVVTGELFDQNPKRSAKKPNGALRRYFTKLRKIN